MRRLPSPAGRARLSGRARRRLLPAGLALSLAAGLTACSGASDTPPEAEGTLSPTLASSRRIDLARWDSAAELRSGRTAGLRRVGDRLAFHTSIGSRRVGGTTYDVARWASRWTAPGFSFTQLIASWSATTPKDSWIEIQVRGRTGSGKPTTWDVLGRWASGDRHFKRRTFSGQADDGTSVNVDTWKTSGLTSYQVRVQLMRRAGTGITPSLDTVTAMTSALPSSAGTTSRPGPARGTVLKVPRYSQMIHSGHYPKWGGGGEAWCSPTSTSMVLAYYKSLPPAKLYRFVPAGHTDPWVDYAARMTYDHAYDGTGNWPFNTAYASRWTGSAFVTRLRSLRQAERFIVAGIPLVISVAFSAGELTGAPISASNGHLLVIVGFRKNGNVVVNDPAAATRKGVRRTYRRSQLERIWLEASGGTTYVIHDAAHPLPGGSPGNW